MNQPIVWCLCFLLSLPAFAQDAEPETHNLKVRRSTAHAVSFLLKQTEKNIHGFVVPPQITPHYKMVMMRFREVTYTRRVPEYEYEVVEVMRPVGSGSERTMKKVKERRIVGIKGYHDEEHTRLVHDKDGPIEKLHRKAFYDEEALREGLSIPDGTLGYNGMALHTLLSLGVDHNEPAMRGLKGALEQYVLIYGVPDYTFDVAWMTAALYRWPEDNPKLDQVRLVLLRKLLSGPVNDGVKVRGLWGPICMDDEIMSHHLGQQMDLYEELGEVKRQLAEAEKKERERDQMKAEKAVAELETKLEASMGVMRTISWRSPIIMSKYTNSIKIEPNDEDVEWSPDFADIMHPIRLSVPANDLLLERTTDLESTMYALMALAEVEAVGKLPRSVDRPEVGGKQFRPIDTMAVIKGAFQGVTGCYDARAKGWHAGIQWADMRERYYDFEYVIAKEPVEVESTLTLMADAAAYQSLMALDRIVGLDNLSRSAGGMTRAIETRLDHTLENLKVMRTYNKADHGSRHPYAYVAALSGYQWSLAGLELTRPSFYEDYSEYMMKQQQEDGGWGNEKTYIRADSPSTHELQWARYIARLKQLDKEIPKNRTKAHFHRYIIRQREALTLEALRFVSAGTYPAVAVHWQSDGLMSTPVTLGRGLTYLNHRGGTLSYVSAKAWPPPEIPDVPAVVVLTGKGALSPADLEAMKPLHPYIRAGGVIIAEAPASEEGKAFALSLYEALADVLPGRTFGDLPPDTYLLQALEKRPPVRGIMHADGTVGVVFLMIGPKTQGYSLQRDHAGRMLATILEARLPPLLLERAYPILDDMASPFEFEDPAPEGEEAVEEAAVE